MDDTKMVTLLGQLAAATKQMGSGLDAVDRGQGWKYFNAAKQKSQGILGRLPSTVLAQFPKKSLSLHTWSQYRQVALRLKKQYQ